MSMSIRRPCAWRGWPPPHRDWGGATAGLSRAGAGNLGCGTTVTFTVPIRSWGPRRRCTARWTCGSCRS